MTKVNFNIKYDGPALRDNQMDVRDLAPALIALSELLEQASKEVYPKSAPVRVEVKGNFKAGSFGIDLIAIQPMMEQIISLLNGEGATAASNLLGILSGVGLLGGGGLVGLIIKLKGRKPHQVKTEGDSMVFVLESQEEISVDLVTGKLYHSRMVRQQLAKVLSPLDSPGIDTFVSGQLNEAVTTVTKEDFQYFVQSAADADVVSDETTRSVLQIESLSFKDGNKWKVTDGGSSFWAELEDEDFLGRINDGSERFGKGDILVVELQRVQIMTDTGLKQEYFIAKVVEHRGPPQGRLID